MKITLNVQWISENGDVEIDTHRIVGHDDVDFLDVMSAVAVAVEGLATVVKGDKAFCTELEPAESIDGMARRSSRGMTDEEWQNIGRKQ